MTESENISYREIHAYMLKKTQEYYRNPPAPLVEEVIAAFKAQGEDISWETAKERVSLIIIQRYIKKEMSEKWPQFMGSIPSNDLPKTVD